MKKKEIPIEQGWIIGYKEIAKYCGVRSIAVIKHWEAHHHMPILRMPTDTRVMALRSELDNWVINFTELIRMHHLRATVKRKRVVKLAERAKKSPNRDAIIKSNARTEKLRLEGK